MTGLRLTLRGKYLKIFEKHPIPWHRKQHMVGMPAHYSAAFATRVDGNMYSPNIVYTIMDDTHTTVMHSDISAHLCHRLWEMYQYVMRWYGNTPQGAVNAVRYARERGEMPPRVIQQHPLPWTKERWQLHSGITTDIVDAWDSMLCSWTPDDPHSELYEALFELSRYAWDILQRGVRV